MHYLIVFAVLMVLFGPVRAIGIAIGAYLGMMLVMHPVHAIWIIPVLLLAWGISSRTNF